MVSSMEIDATPLERRYGVERWAPSAIPAIDRLVARPVFLKVGSGERAEQLLAEARVLARYGHRNLVPLHEVITNAQVGRERVAGFATAAIDGVPLPTGLAYASVLQVAEALAGLVDCVHYLHKVGLLHLDLKPDNVLWSRGRAIVLDLGAHRSIASGGGGGGGTFRYASPESMRGMAPSPATDVYALGRLFLEVLGARRGPEWRWLADLARRMSDTDVERRMRSLQEVRWHLVEHGASPVPTPGAPPFLGRDRELALLEQWRGRRSACLWGPEGAGRRRLAKMWLASGDGGSRLDLLGATQPAAIIRTMTERGLALDARVLCGPRELLSDDALASAESAIDELAAAGGSVVWIARRPMNDAWSLPVGPLPLDACLAVAAFAGVPASQFHANRSFAIRWPGDLLQMSVPDSELPAPARLAREYLTRLPRGIPRALVPELPTFVSDVLDDLLDIGFVRETDGGLLDVRGAVPVPADPPPGSEAFLERPDLDALWCALLACSLGRIGQARKLLPFAVAAAADRGLALTLLCEALVSAGVREARIPLADCLLLQGKFTDVAKLLDGAKSLKERLLLARALRDLDLDRSLGVARSLAAETNDADAWASVAQAAARSSDWNVFADARARAAQCGASRSTLLELDLLEAFKRMDPDLAEARLVELESVPLSEVTIASQSHAGAMLARLARHADAVRWFLRGVSNAERSGDLPRSAGMRLNLANALTRMGRPDRARTQIDTVIAIAERMQLPAMLMYAYASFVIIEMQLDRLPSARAALEALKDLATKQSSPLHLHRAELQDAIVLVREGEFARAYQLFQSLHPDVSGDTNPDHLLARAEACVVVGQPEEAIQVLDRIVDPLEAGRELLAKSLRGIASITIGRNTLREARSAADAAPSVAPWIRGRVLLSAAGEGIDPSSVVARLADLEEAALLLNGPLGERAAAHRDFLRAGPSAELDSISALLESTAASDDFPRALAELLTEAFGANRALIVTRLPGLGRQIASSAMGSGDAPKLSEIVLEKITQPDDFWLVEDAFADEHLRQSSKTVDALHIRSIVAVAIPVGERVVGAIYLDDLRRAGRFDMGHVQSLLRLGRTIGRLIEGLGRPGLEPGWSEPEDVHGIVLPDRASAQRIRSTVAHVKATGGCNVLLTGPTGVGKTHFAERLSREVLGLKGIEFVGLRGNDPAMLLSQLYGTRQGDFTGARASIGAVDRALRQRRALFLDEIQSLGDLSQHVLLALLDNPRRIGGHTVSDRAIEDKLYVILATNQDVTARAWREQFRADLWYRMSPYHIDIPSLADRGPEVVYRYLQVFLGQVDLVPEQVFESQALRELTHRSWPGNLRQLQAFAERARIEWELDKRSIGTRRLASLGLDDAIEPLERTFFIDGIEANELKVMLERALEASNWEQKDAAKAIGWTRSRLSKMLKRLGMRDMVRAHRKLALVDRDGD
jgi:transcriptional regulator with GAF, ATPase, and Fis domain/serine/threonine protein kinase/tetratricopeptide (TPR) repeat protein